MSTCRLRLLQHLECPGAAAAVADVLHACKGATGALPGAMQRLEGWAWSCDMVRKKFGGALALRWAPPVCDGSNGTLLVLQWSLGLVRRHHACHLHSNFPLEVKCALCTVSTNPNQGAEGNLLQDLLSAKECLPGTPGMTGEQRATKTAQIETRSLRPKGETLSARGAVREHHSRAALGQARTLRSERPSAVKMLS